MQALLIYELVNKIISKTLMIKILHISLRGYDKGFYGNIGKISLTFILNNDKRIAYFMH